MEVEHIAPYCCVGCGGPLLTTDPNNFRCNSCSRSYPLVSGIPIFTLRPKALLSASVQALRAADSRIHELSALSTGDAGHDPSHSAFQARAGQALTGMRANLALTETYMRPAEALLPEKEADPDFIDAISNCGAGLPPDLMLPYFYQDWGGTNDFFNVKSLIVTALLQHRSDAEAIAVLGAGACGLVQAAAADFEYAYGIDLSLPTLLIARGALLGDSIAVHLENAGWRATEIYNSEARRSNVRLAVADVANLPFADGSMSAVVTQYLMDIGHCRRPL